MKSTNQTFFVIIGFILLGALGIGGYFVLEYLVMIFAKIDSQVAMVTAIASVVALLVARIIASSIHKASKQNKAQQVQAEKVATYQQFIDVWADFLRQGLSLDLQSPSRRSEDLHALERLLILCSAPGVVKAYGALQALATKLDLQSPEVVSQFAKVLMEMRKDLGLSSQNLKAEDLLQLLFNYENASPEPGVARQPQDLQPRVSLAANA